MRLTRRDRERMGEAALEEWIRLESERALGSRALAAGASSQVSGSSEGGKGLAVSSRPVGVAMAMEFLLGALEGLDMVGEFREGLLCTITGTEAAAGPGRAEAGQELRVLRMLDLLAEAVQAHRERGA